MARRNCLQLSRILTPIKKWVAWTSFCLRKSKRPSDGYGKSSKGISLVSNKKNEFEIAVSSAKPKPSPSNTEFKTYGKRAVVEANSNDTVGCIPNVGGDPALVG